MSSDEPEKLRRIHMNASSCSEFSSSSEGLKPLVAPNTSTKSRKDPNKGLYPKCAMAKSTIGSKSDRFRHASFSKASDIYSKRKRDPSQPHVNSEMPLSLPTLETSEKGVTNFRKAFQNGSEPTSKRKRKEVPSQNNKITGYFSQSRLSKCRPAKDCSKGHHEESDFPKCYLEESDCSQGYHEEGDCSKVQKEESTVVTCDSNSRSDSKEKCAETVESLRLSSKRVNSNSEKYGVDEPDYFGLFGANETEENVEPFYFNKLPSEVMEHIFYHLPFLDLQKCKSVCHLWNDIITNRSFIQWKSTYYELKHGSQRQAGAIANILLSLDGHSANNCLHALVRFMKDGFSRRPAPDMFDKLEKHRKFPASQSVLKERFPDSCEGQNPWCIIATIVLISEEVKDVSDIISHLVNNNSQSFVVDVLEALYCIASFLLYCMHILRINHGLHYRVYYALYMYENHIPFGTDSGSVQSIELSGQQTMHNYCSSLHFTYEQNRIISHQLQQGDVIKVIAFAGSGKTSTLIELARRYPQLKFLNVMFNKSVCDHAQKLFPKNVECRTAHSLAFVSKGKPYAHRLVPKFTVDVVRESLNLSEYPFEVYKYCRCVISTVQNFMASGDMEITMKHTPTNRPFSRDTERLAVVQVLTPDEKLHISQSAVKMWELLSDRSENCPVTHDVYLKIYQLSKPKIKQYHCIMVDEAQDCNAAMLDIVLSQNVPVILVGDPHQQIYAFRGSKNALTEVKSTRTYYLTKSFRFGPEIAYIASCCIEVLKDYKQETLVGCNKPGTVRGAIEGQYAIIARSNVGLFNEAIRLCCQRNFKHEDEPRSIHGAFVGGINSYGLNQIEDLYRLKALTGKPANEIKPEDMPRDKFIKKFHSFRSLMAYAEKKDDTELAYKIEIVLQHNEKIPEYMAILRQKCSTPLELANVVFSTAHKAKGFEFETVRLSDDYHVGRTPGIYDVNSKDSEEEHNILYVALTRAKRSLFLTEKLYSVLLLAQEKFEYPVLSSDVMQDQEPLNCVLCFTPIKPHTVLSLVRRRVALTTGRVLREGVLCTKCAAAPYYRPQVIRDPVIMYLDPIDDYAHRSLKFLVGPLPSDPQLPNDFDNVEDLHAMDLIYVINVGIPP